MARRMLAAGRLVTTHDPVMAREIRELTVLADVGGRVRYSKIKLLVDDVPPDFIKDETTYALRETFRAIANLTRKPTDQENT